MPLGKNQSFSKPDRVQSVRRLDARADEVGSGRRSACLKAVYWRKHDQGKMISQYPNRKNMEIGLARRAFS